MSKLEGLITFYNSQKGFGFIQSVQPVEDGFSVQRYFLPHSQIIFMQSRINVGCRVKFVPAPPPARKPDGLWIAEKAEVFDPEAAATTAGLAALAAQKDGAR
jgi:hypothetical protein